MDETTERIVAYYDSLGVNEWHRLPGTRRGQVSLEIHQRFLAENIQPGFRVLEIGAGPGRFTISLAELGARVVVTDLSPVQLDLNREYVSEADAEGAVEDRYLLDIKDTSRFADQEFDAVVAYGGPFSYVFESAPETLVGLLRIGGVLVASVMSTLGTWRFFLNDVINQAQAVGQDANDTVINSGDLRHLGTDQSHVCKMYRWSELKALVEDSSGEVLSASASNFASATDEETLERIASVPDHWRRFIEHEVRDCRESGALDGGTHILFSARAIELS